MKAWKQVSPTADLGAEAAGPRRGRPLRFYLVGLVLLFVVAAAAGIWSGWVQAERDAMAAARKDAEFGARKGAEQVGEGLMVVRSTVDGLAQNPGVGQIFANPKACQLAFSLRSDGGGGHLDVLGPDGTIVCSSQPPKVTEATAYAGAPWLPAASKGPQTITPAMDARTGHPAILITAPIAGTGLVAAFVDLNALGEIAGDSFGGARELEFIIATADKSTIIARWPDGGRWVGTPTENSRFTAPERTGEGIDVTGARRMYAQAVVESAGWRVWAGADRAGTLLPAYRLAQRQALIVAIGLLAGLLATALVYRRIARPISRLRAAVHAATVSGDLNTPVPVNGPREVGDLGAEFSNLFATVDRELSERRRAEEVAREHERNYRQMFDASPYPIYLFDVENLAIIAVNDAAVHYYGHSRDILLAMDLTGLSPAEDGAALRAATAAGEPVERGRRQRHLKSDGTVTEVTVTSHVTSFAGRTVRCAFVDDITEREHLERRLRQSERLESLGHLAGGIAHDFNNLLSIINGYASMSAADVEPIAEADPAWRPLHGDLLEIVAAGDRATALTRQLLAFARADAVVELRVLDLNAVVADVDKLLRRTLGEDIELISHLTDQPQPIKADVGRLEQVLVNLAVNARDAMPGGGKLTIDTDLVHVDEHYAEQHPGLNTGSYMRLRVSDTGVGMTRATLERAFEPFFTTKPKGHGTGLGLATIYGIVTQTGGHAQIYSEVGQGTTVAALFPVTDETAAPTETRSPMPQHGSGQTILLVEDNDSLRELTERILQRSGYTVLPAATAADARDIAASRPDLDLLLTDVVMPDLNGPDLAALLRADQPAMRIIFMSGYAETVLAARSALPPGAILLNKPVTADHLLTTVARVLHSETSVR
jgi:PAS domain S-box-containing protein